jgi:starch synthase
MYSLAYGTLPIVRRTGGLADTVIGWSGANADVANGFVFDELTVPAVDGAVKLAQRLFGTAGWRHLVRNAMNADFSWARSATHYEDAYRRARALRGLPW